MARSIEIIEQEIIDDVNDNRTSLSPINSVSNVSIFRQMINIMAQAINQFEVFNDIFLDEVTLKADSAVSMTEAWFADRIQNYFQYSSGTPQILELDPITNVHFYPIVDESLRVVTKAACLTLADGTVKIKSAQGEPDNLGPLDQNTLDALTSYVTQIRGAGQKTDVISIEADRVYINMDVMVNSQFVSSTVKDEIIANIDQYFSELEFNGKIFYQKIEAVVLGTPGVVDIDTKWIRRRGSSETTYDEVNTNIELFAGYCITEDISGITIEDSLNLFPV